MKNRTIPVRIIIPVAAILLQLLLHLPCFSQATDDMTKTLLWKIEGKDMQPSYLYGTIHLLPQQDFHLAEKTKSAFQESEQIVMEMDMDDPTLQTKMMQHIAMKDGTTLKQLMKPEDYQKLDQLLQTTIGANIAMFNSWKPLVLVSLLYTNFIEGKPASFELTFVEMALAAKKEVLGLETPEEQLAVFDAIPYQKQIDGIVEMLNEEEKMKAMYADMIKLYKEEEIEELYDMMLKELDDPKTKAALLDERNKNWVTAIPEMAQEQSSFIAVGAGHLAGNQGLISLLRKAGYTLTPVE